MIKRIIAILLATAVLIGCGGKKPVPASRLQQPSGQFSFVTPDGWFRTKLAGIDFTIVSADSDFGIDPNIFVDSVETSGKLTNVIAKVIETNKSNHKDYKIAHQGDFVTESGLTGVKISAGRANKNALPLALFHYLIKDNDRIIVITCTCADPVKQKYEPIFDSAMKSLQSELASQQ